MKKFLSIGASFALALSSLVALAPAAQAAPQDNMRMITVSEGRTLTPLTNFQAEADERALSISAEVTFSSAQYAAIGGGKKLTLIVELKNGSAVVARERNVSAGGSVSLSGFTSGSNTFITNSDTGSLALTASLDSNLLPSTNYQVDIRVLVDGVLSTINADYTISSLTATFTKVGKSIVAAGDESSIRFFGETCLSAAAYSSLVANDVLELTVSDAASNSYSIFGSIYSSGGSPSFFQQDQSSNYVATVTSQMLSDKAYLTFDVTKSAPAAGTYEPVVSIKKLGDTTELSEVCAATPATAPTLTASATGLTLAFDREGADRVRCNIADSRYPHIPIVSFESYSPSTSCLFTGLKQGSYVGWFDRLVRLSPSNFSQLTSNPSAVSASATYAGGNGSYRTFTGTSGGSGQGSLTLSDISYVGSDFQTERRSSDGSGGLLVGSIEAADDELKIRRLTPTGMSSTFGGSGVVTVTLPPANLRMGAPNVGWYGASRDKWMLLATLPGVPTFGGSGSFPGANILSTGDFAGNSQTSALISSTDVGRFCQANIIGPDNTTQSASLQTLISAPTADPLLIVNCNIKHGNSGYYSSNVPFLVTYSNGEFVLKASLGDEPTSSEKCSQTTTSAVNSGATGSEVMLAAFQRTWNPSATDCFTWNSAITSASLVSRDIFTVTSSYARTAVRDVLTVTGTNEPALGSGGTGMSASVRLIVSGTNTHLMISEVSGVSPNQTFKYRIARLTNNSFGTFEQQPYLNVASTDSFNSGTFLGQIADYSENEAGSVLLARNDFSSGSTAARVDLATGTMTSYQQMASSSGFGLFDGGSIILGNSSGDLNFYGITSRTTAVRGQWATSGAFDPALTALPINQGASNTGVSQGLPGQVGPGPVAPPPSASVAPYTGPVVNAPGEAKAVGVGAKVKLDGSKLSGVTKVTINGKDAKVKVNSDGELEITVPAGLAKGTYDLVVTSDSGVLTVQDGIRVDGSASSGEIPRPSTKLKEDNTVKVHVFNVVGAGKVQIMFNGKEVAWINTDDPDDAKLLNDYLVRTLELLNGKNVIEIFVDGKRVDRKSYTKVDDSSDRI